MHGQRSNKEMIDIVGNICGLYSIPYMNISKYSNAENYQVKAIFDEIVLREIRCTQADISKKELEMQNLRKRLKELEKLGVIF